MATIDTLNRTQAANPAEGGAKRRAGWAGAASVGLALGVTELAAGLVDKVPSALASVGRYVVDYAPPGTKDIAVDLFGTGDKGALAIGTTIIAVVIGVFVGRVALRRPAAGTLAFGLFGLLGVGAALSQPLISPILTILAIGVAAWLGWWTLTKLLAAVRFRPAESPTDGLPADPGRRRFTGVVTGVGAVAVAGGAGGRWLIVRRSEEAIGSTTIPGAAPAPTLGAGTSFDGINGLAPIVVPNDDFYRIDTALVVPRVDPATWQLEVNGMVDRPLSFSLDDLLGRDLVEEYVTIACVSNEVGGHLVGNALWSGVRLADVLDEAGVQAGATQIVGTSVDGFTAGFPTEVAFDGREPLIAVGMNGEALPARHGYPARLIVPGLYGYVSATKWISEITLTTWEDFDGYWIPRGWSKEGPIKTQSRIDHPRNGEEISGVDTVIAGVAWAPTRGVARVEVRVDGDEWLEAELTTPLSDQAWVQWKVDHPVAAGRHLVEVRATDGTGETQTADLQAPAPNGATGYHDITFTAV